MKSCAPWSGADNAEWVGAVRLGDSGSGDPASGWRPPAIAFLHPNERLTAAVVDQLRELDKQFANAAIAKLTAAAGRFRACRLADLVPDDWRESAFYRSHYRDVGRADAVYVTFPVNADTESCFGIFRAPERPPFTEAERDTLAYALRGIKWFHRRLLLGHGLVVIFR